MARRRLGPATIEVLQAIAGGHAYGFDIMDVTGLPGGTVYPALAALERDGMVSSNWEDPRQAQAEKRPPRRYYTVARQGEQALRRELERLRSLQGIVEGGLGCFPRVGIQPILRQVQALRQQIQVWSGHVAAAVPQAIMQRGQRGLIVSSQ